MNDFLKGDCKTIIGTLRYMNPETSDERRRYLDFFIRCLNMEIKNANRSTVIKALMTKINKIKQNTERI